MVSSRSYPIANLNGRVYLGLHYLLVTVASGPEAALASYTDVCTRTITINEMIQNPRMLVMLGLSNVDFGSAIQEKSEAVKEAIKSAN